MSYIGNEPIISATRTITEVTATAGQTVFNANGGYTVGYLDVFLNGAQLQTVDFTATNGSSITLTEAAQVGDVIRLVAWGTFVSSNNVSKSGDTMTGALLLPDGSASAPALSNDGDSNTGIFFPAADTIAFAEGGAEVARFDSSGNLGIGTSSPSAKLSIAGSTASDYTTGMTFSKSGGNTYAIAPDANDLFVRSVTAGIEVCRFTYGGNLLVGATAFDIIGANATGFAVAGSGEAQFSRSGAVVIKVHRKTSTGAMVEFFYNGPTVIGTISTNGSSTSYNTSSDYRLKENVAPMIGALAKVALLKPCTYTWKADGSHSEGFIAHELQAVVPDAVTGEKDAVKEDGSIDPQGIDTSFLVATLTAAIQEQQAIITDLKTRIETLENK